MPTSPPRKLARYFQFPLCALAYADSPRTRLNAIVNYTMVNVGRARWAEMSATERAAAVRRWEGDPPFSGTFDPNSTTHLALLAGAEHLRLSGGSIRGFQTSYDAFRRHLTQFEAAHGRDPLVRIRTDFLFEARDRTGLSYPELAVLAAIYSVIGDKQGPVLLAQSTIRHRALGYRSPAICAAELPRRTDGARPLSEWVLRRTRDRLCERKLVHRVTFGRRLTYYSHRMTEHALREAVIARKTYPSIARLHQRAADDDLTATIRNLRAAAAGQSPLDPQHRTLQPPFDGNPGFLPT